MQTKSLIGLSILAAIVCAFPQEVKSQDLMSGYSSGSMASYSAPLPVSPVMDPMGFRWDYRFDAQYNSTIKPYLRWYRRQNSGIPRSGVRYPYYHGPQPVYGQQGGGYSTGCGGMQTGSTGYGYTQNGPSWFNPHRYMNQGFMNQGFMNQGFMNQGYPMQQNSMPHNATQDLIRRELRMSKSKPETAPTTKVAWVLKDDATKSVSVLYQQPHNAAQLGFAKAHVTTIRGRVSNVDWIEDTVGDAIPVVDKK